MFIDRAGSQSKKFTNDLPRLNELKFPDSEKYTYAYAINRDSSLTPDKFDNQYDRLNMDVKKSISQDDMINYFNTNNVSEKEGMYYWTTYGENHGEPWKTMPRLKNGTWSH